MKKALNPKGFTLVEVIIAIFVLSIALLAQVPITTMIIKGNAFTKMQSTATTIARDQLETLKNSSFSSMSSSTGYPTTWVTCSAPNTSFQEQWGVTANSDNTTKTIAMNVQWTWQGQNHTVTLNTIIAQ